MKKSTRIVTVCMITMMAFAMVGCEKEKTKKEKEPEVATELNANGVADYKEQEISVPTGGAPFQFFFDQSGKMNFYMKDIGPQFMSFTKYRYQDDDWEEVETGTLNDAMDEARMANVYGVYESASGKVYVVRVKNGDAASSDEASYDWFTYEDDQMVKLDNILYDDTSEPKEKFSSIMMAGEDVIVIYQNGVMSRFDSKGQKIKTYDTPVGASAKVCNDNIYATSPDSENIMVIDLESGELLSTIPCSISSYGAAFGTDENGDVYCLKEDGIYRLDETKKTIEKVVDGTDFSVFDSGDSGNMLISNLDAWGGVFTTVYSYSAENTRNYKIYKYEEK